MKFKLIAYALDFTSFLVQKADNISEIKNIILFGSVARGDEGAESDIDIFIDTINEGKLEKALKKCLDDFLKSAKYKNYWQLLGIQNEIKLTVGDLKKWSELKPSIISNGILLYGKFQADIKEGKHETFLIWENIRPNSKRVLFNKQLLGYNQKGKFYQGLLQKHGGIKMGKGCIVVPLEETNLFLKLFRKNKIGVKIKKVLDYSA